MEEAVLPLLSTSVHLIPPSELQLGKPLGKGSYGEVYYSRWQGTEAAVKQLYLANLQADLSDDFKQEALIMANCQHPNVVRLYGICTQPGHYSLVMEYLPKGSLYEVLHNVQENLPWNPLRWQIAIDFEKGLSYLHSKEIIHRDLKSLNVLLDQNYHAKIGDFGMSKVKVSSQSTATTTQKGMGTSRWRAPELFKRGVKPDKAADIYSSGMVLWEIASRQLPYADAVDDMAAITWIKDGEKEQIPSNCPKGYGDIILSCWQAPEWRPTAANLVRSLQAVCPELEEAVVSRKVYPFKGDKSWHFDLATPGIESGEQQPYVLLRASEKDKEKVMQFYGHHAPTDYDVVSIDVIYNANMNRKFNLYMDELQNRHNNPAFMPRWETYEPDNEVDKTLRKETYQSFEQLAHPYTDTDYPAVKLLPLWHGTRPEILPSLLTTGYANLATTDSGYFGKGIYGAWEAEYSQRVYSKGALVLNWAAMFSPFPVIFPDMARLKLAEGKANYGNYDAHFVPVYPASKNPKETVYYACKPGQKPVYTEVVLFQSAAVLPQYLVQLEKSDIKELTLSGKPTWVASQPLVTTTHPQMLASESRVASPSAIFRRGYDCLHQNPQKAVDYFEQASKQGYLPADVALGFLYYSGKMANLGRDVTKSQYYYDRLKNNMDTLRQEAKKDRVDYQTALGFCYAYGIGVAQDFKQAAIWYQMAAEQGDVNAQCNLALLYEEGKGVEQDQKQAIKYYQLSAQQGNRIAMFNVGICYYKGNGVKKDLQQALYYFKPLAEEGEAQAQYFVGVCYVTGLGVTLELIKGKAYLQKAAAQGHQGAEQQLASLSVGERPATVFAQFASKVSQNSLNLLQTVKKSKPSKLVQ